MEPEALTALIKTVRLECVSDDFMINLWPVFDLIWHNVDSLLESNELFDMMSDLTANNLKG